MKNNRKVALITGASVRLGKSISKELHSHNIDIAIHCGSSLDKANQLKETFNKIRKNSAFVIQYDLANSNASEFIINSTFEHYQRLDYLVNNAAIFYPTPINDISDQQMKDFLQINFIQPVKLLQAAYSLLKENGGSAVNIIDIYAERGLSEHTIYSASKAALLEATKALAAQFAPFVRVNAVSPGAILWPSQTEPNTTQNKDEIEQQQKILDNTALKRIGSPQDISQTVCYLLLEAHYTTGSLINVDGGRRLYL